MAITRSEPAALFFPEPDSDDPTWATPGEGMSGWLARSTIARASAYRAFLNRNLAALPLTAANAIVQDMRTADFYRAHFEMITGRVLQVLGADLEYEIAAGTRRPDWRARFDIGSVLVEATSPSLHLEETQKLVRLEPLKELVERLAPDDWSVVVNHLPELGPSDSRVEVRRFLETQFARVPPASTATGIIDIDGHLDCGYVHLELLPRRIAHTKIVMGPGVATWGDDTAMRVAGAYRAKRAQVRDAAAPRVLAVHGGPWSNYTAFDGGLFGVGEDAVSEPAFVAHRTTEPTFAAVLAFRGLELTRGREPLLYRHPRSTLTFPAELEQLEVRELVDGVPLSRPARRTVLPNLLGELVIP